MCQANQVPLELLDPKVTLDLKVKMDHLEHLVQMELRDPVVRLDILGVPENLVPLDYLVTQD